MANPWFRLWTEMVNDPKWRTIARKSGQKIGDVIAVYVHMMTNASNATERGHLQNWNDEDVASALDIDTAHVQAIREAMQARVLDGEHLTGWSKRQPLREDGSAERGREARERKATEEAARKMQEAENERIRTQANAIDQQKRGEEKREELTSKASTPAGVDVASDAGNPPAAKSAKPDCPHQAIIELYHEVLPQCPKVRDWTPARSTQLRARWNEDEARQSLDYWQRFFEYVKACPFLVGQQAGGHHRPFFADLEWLTKSSNFTKVRERKYE